MMQGDPLGFFVTLAFTLGTCLSGAWWCLRRWSQARHLLDTPTSKIRSAAQGYVELYGVLHELPGAEVRGPLTGKPCLWWRYRIEEYQSSDNKSTWRVVERGSSEAWLRLDDGTGECLIDPRGAEVRPVVRDSWEGNLRHPLGPVKSGFWRFLSSGRRYRYVEERLHAGQPLYAIGDFRTQGAAQQGFDPTAAQGAVIREWKGDFAGLLRRFDSDGNGQLDEREWDRVRLAARLEAEDRQRLRAQEPARNQMARPREAQPFILANAGEDELARGFYWQAAAGAVLCLVGALATAWVLGVQNW
ncbi:GIDE domain-containing protein [Pseudomonas sp. AA-38]|uniref:GIDE domain-containing protein n=1 Tax=Pseudomonas sp. AA-38 TaxID=3028807 RepID=UPI0023F66F75|nr:GIDE domain-containing protein [Pseudomonas sp. AA-38]